MARCELAFKNTEDIHNAFIITYDELICLRVVPRHNWAPT